MIAADTLPAQVRQAPAHPIMMEGRSRSTERAITSAHRSGVQVPHPCRRPPIALMLLFALLCAACGKPAGTGEQQRQDAAAQPSLPEFDPLREQIHSELAEHPEVASIAVAVARGGQIVWAEGFGWADREQQRPATADTPYSLASISKPITATGLMLLVAEGKIDLDAAANDYLGEAKLTARVGDARDATVRRVADHTAGLPLHYQFFYADEPARRPPMDETIRRYGNLVTAPGEIFEYSNLGYGILDEIIARVSGRPYAEFMQARVFGPLGMTRSAIDIAPAWHGQEATRYDEDGQPLPFYDFDHPGGSAVYASARDLARFAMFHLKNDLPDQQAILDHAAIDRMHQPPSNDVDPESHYGIGFGIVRQGERRRIAHSGSMGGVSTQMRLFPEDDVAIVVLSNTRSAMPARIADAITLQLVPDWRPDPPRSEDQPSQQGFAPPAALVGRWQGHVHTEEHEMPVEFDIRTDGDVHARIGDQLRTLLDDIHFEDGRLTGQMAARIDTPDTLRYPNTIRLSLTLRDDVLNGSATNVDWGNGLPHDPRARNALTHWIELRKAGD